MGILTSPSSPTRNSEDWQSLQIAVLLEMTRRNPNDLADWARAHRLFNRRPMRLTPALEDLYRDARGKGYAQPLGGRRLKGVFEKSFPARDVWAEQALHQHHATTYRKLVDAAYPDGPHGYLPPETSMKVPVE